MPLKRIAQFSNQQGLVTMENPLLHLDCKKDEINGKKIMNLNLLGSERHQLHGDKCGLWKLTHLCH